MADINSFFEEGIKSYIEQSFLKYSKSIETIFDKNFDTNLIQPLFISDISLYKNLIQKNKLKSEIWGLIYNLIDQKINQLLCGCNDVVKNMKNQVIKYTQKIKKSNGLIEQYRKLIKEKNEEINNNNKSLKEKKDNSDYENDLNLEDKNYENEIAQCNGKLINEITEYRKKKEDEKENINRYQKKLRNKERYVIIGKIRILKIKILHITITILINEINGQEIKNKNYNKENNYKLLNDYINDFIDKIEKNKDKVYIDYTSFIKNFIIQLALIINNKGYKDINISFLNQILNMFNNIKKVYSNSHISEVIKYVEKLISKPDTFLCPNAFKILKDASLRKIKPRSRNNSFDKNDIVNNNQNNKIEGNRKIDEFITYKKREEKSDSEDDEEDFQKKLSNVISFKNSSTQNNIPNINFLSQSSLGLHDTYKHKSLLNDSALSNNSLIYIDNQNGTNLLNSSRISLDDSISKQGMYRSGSCSELLGINSRLASNLPTLRNTKKEKKKNLLEKFGKKMKMKKINIERKSSNEKLDKIFGKEIRNIVNHNFYNNEGSSYNKNKNTTATENKKEKNNTKKISSEILAVKTPVKNTNENSQEKEEQNINNNILKQSGIKKNLQLLFNQQTDKF